MCYTHVVEPEEDRHEEERRPQQENRWKATHPAATRNSSVTDPTAAESPTAVEKNGAAARGSDTNSGHIPPVATNSAASRAAHPAAFSSLRATRHALTAGGLSLEWHGSTPGQSQGHGAAPRLRWGSAA